MPFQAWNQITIQLDDLQPIGRFQQRGGENAQTGTDLYQMLVGFRCDGFDNTQNNGRITQKMLAKTLSVRMGD
jgi:hypothetical protein